MDIVTLGMARAEAMKRHAHHPPQTMVVIGDSLTEQGGMIAAAPQLKPVSAWTWANVLLGQRFEILKNSGIGGQTTTQIRSRLQTDALDLKPGWVHLLCGTNNMGTAGGVATAKADITAMLDSLNAAGVMTILGTIPPRITPSYTGTMKADTMELNRWIVQTARTRPNVILADYFTALAEAGGNYADPLYGGNSTSDGVHLSARGGYACGRALADAILAHGTSAPAQRFHPSVSANGINLLPYPHLNGTSATAAPQGTTVSGSAAASATWNTAPAKDQPMPWKVLTVANGAGNMSLQQNANVGANGLAVGDTVRAYLEFDMSGLDQAAAAGAQAFYLSVRQWNGSSYTNTDSAMSDYNSPNADRAGVIRTHDVTIVAGTTVVVWELFIWGGGTYKIRRAGLYRTAALNAA
ncbi:hypothetical protein GCM10012320_08170 [Sinomonas cellulolyticus]|uniref:SGNH hydrolase-type esterase domain-containing protein n=1 Tax=Sinomonas cellulolyticus TaxID=2801916 RepID=A0ABS1K3S2_9MICC|nr:MULTISPECIES: GDSL-type esterase/lipase family protein [Sinomonas]MBL0706280.1 hypothetical protein [Sinomonas cellulolyticus]GHG43833.1 hypothetical protein GCM10012320_08170 [Sinomonas sp. KCTC 49339]